MVRDKEVWHASVHRISKSQIWLGSWTMNNKEVKDLYSENCKMLMKEIKDDTNRWKKIYHVFGLGESILLKWLNYPRQIPMFQSIWKRIWLQLFQLWPWLVESWSLLSNFWLKCFSHLTSIISGAKPMGPSPRTTFVTIIAMSWPHTDCWIMQLWIF